MKSLQERTVSTVNLRVLRKFTNVSGDFQESC